MPTPGLLLIVLLGISVVVVCAAITPFVYTVINPWLYVAAICHQTLYANGVLIRK